MNTQSYVSVVILDCPTEYCVYKILFVQTILWQGEWQLVSLVFFVYLCILICLSFRHCALYFVFLYYICILSAVLRIKIKLIYYIDSPVISLTTKQHPITIAYLFPQPPNISGVKEPKLGYNTIRSSCNF